MSSQDKILRIGFALFSALSSFFFVFYAVGVLFGSDASSWLRSFAYVALGYGLMNIYILSWVWRTRARWASTANLVIALCMFGAVVIDTYRVGPEESRQWMALGGLAAVLAVNWWTTRVLSRPDPG